MYSIGLFILVVQILDARSCVVAHPLATSTAQSPWIAQPVVNLGYSQYMGTSLGSGVNQFLGMRYAAPPLGDLRFRAPINPLFTTGIQNATKVNKHYISKQ
jgi:hypothetical protein